MDLQAAARWSETRVRERSASIHGFSDRKGQIKAQRSENKRVSQLTVGWSHFSSCSSETNGVLLTSIMQILRLSDHEGFSLHLNFPISICNTRVTSFQDTFTMVIQYMSRLLGLHLRLISETLICASAEERDYATYKVYLPGTHQSLFSDLQPQWCISSHVCGHTPCEGDHIFCYLDRPSFSLFEMLG